MSFEASFTECSLDAQSKYSARYAESRCDSHGNLQVFEEQGKVLQLHVAQLDDFLPADVRPPTICEDAREEAAVPLEARPQEVEVRSLDLDDDVPVGVPELCRARVQRRECRLSGWWDPRPLWRRTRQDGCRNGSILTRSRLWLTSFVLHGQRLDGGGCSRREARRRSMRSGLCMSFRLGLVHLRGVDSGSSSRHRPRRYILRLLLLGS